MIWYNIKKIAETMDAPVPTPATTTNATVPVPKKVAAAAAAEEEEGVAVAAAPGERGCDNPCTHESDKIGGKMTCRILSLIISLLRSHIIMCL